ncbi:SRPBCC family protein [Terricaulis sp.]|uniref:SRPBCC family protein n=1 Tax=Terricaulis sp. TaxID=2768686 RepID=UPI0037835352
MRWFLGLVLVVALVTGAAYAVGRFVLPNTLTVSETVSVERPRAAVYAMTNDLRIVKEWSPFYALDPEADYAFGGEGPGEGQTMRWVSAVRDVGSGRMSIVQSDENERIEGILELKDRATLNSRFDLHAAQGGTAVTWSVSAECSDGWVNVPCRYMNLISKSTIQSHLLNGLNRLKTLAEQLPNVDFEGFDIAQTPVESQNVLFVDVAIGSGADGAGPTFNDRDQAEREGIDSLDRFVANNQVVRGDGLVRVFPQVNGVNGVYTFSVGYPFNGAPPGRLVGVRIGSTPSGAALRAMYVGRRSQIPLMYQRLDAYMQAHRISPRDGAERWEIVRQVEAPTADSAYPNDPIEHTEIYFPID